MAKMPRIEGFCTREPQFEGEKVFGSQKRKADISFEFEHELHKPNWINFSSLQVKTMSTRVGGASCSLNNIPKELSLDLQEHPIPIDNSGAIHMIAI